MVPGETAFTRIPWDPNSRASPLVIVDSAAFAEEYAIAPIPPPKRAATEVMFTTHPRRCFIIDGRTAFVVRNALVTFNVNTSDHKGSVISRNGFLAIKDPALFTNMSTGLCKVCRELAN